MLFEKIKKIIINHMDLPEDYELSPSLSLKNDVKADSVDAIEIIMELEDEFGIEIPDEEISKFSTLGDLEEYIEKALEE